VAPKEPPGRSAFQGLVSSPIREEI
jgi:hypothetical protein